MSRRRSYNPMLLIFSVKFERLWPLQFPCLRRSTYAENNHDKGSLINKDADIADGEGKQLKKSAKCRSRISKVEYPLDCGADADADQHGQGVSSSREEKVSSLKTVSFLVIPWINFCFSFFSLFLWIGFPVCDLHCPFHKAVCNNCMYFHRIHSILFLTFRWFIRMQNHMLIHLFGCF